MRFVDEVVIEATAGDGGAGSSHFRREKFVPRGGPEGGDGGGGGSVYVKATTSRRTLLDFQFQPLWKAGKGGAGSAQKKFGKDGADIILEVPVGTEIYKLPSRNDTESGEFICDLTEDGATICISKGGKGGRGNVHFKSSTNQAPTYSQPGTKGEKGIFLFTLKLIADIGLVGLPNAGKSTLLSVISEAKPKIGDYPFTTLEPMLGIIKGMGSATCVVADIPGLIDGASSGKGLGISFLKHIERTSVIAHVIDSSSLITHPDNPEILSSEIETIQNELRSYSEELANKPLLYIFSKSDLLPSEWSLDHLKNVAKIDQNADCILISSATSAGISECIASFFRILRENGY